MSHALPAREVLRHRLATAPAELGLALTVPGVLRPLPAPGLPLPEGVRSAPALWDEVAGLEPGPRRESAFVSTSRVAKRDLWRKAMDQEPELAGRGEPPPGFEVVDGLDAGPGRAPLHALVRPPREAPGAVIVVHGMYDSKQSRYVRLAGEWLARQGWGVALVDMRWHGRLLSERWLPTLGLEESLDLVAWTRLLRERWGERPVGLLGFSLGALAVIQALARPEGEEAFRLGGAAFSPPGSLGRSLQGLDREVRLGRQGLEASILHLFQRLLRRRMELLGLAAQGPRPFGRFLEWLVQRLPGGPTSVADFLQAADPLPALAGSRRPLLVVSSRNDPVFPELTAEELRREAEGHRNTRVVPTDAGGHIGHMGTYPEWTAELLHRFFGLAGGVA